MRAGSWDGEDASLQPGWTDRMNADWFGRSSSMPLADVREAFVEGRRHLLEAFGELEELTTDAEEWFEETGPTHYRKHLDDLEAWVGRLHEHGSEMPGPPSSAP